MASKIRVAGIQVALSEDRDQNVARVLAKTREAASVGAQIVLPPELFEGHYFCTTQEESNFARAQSLDSHPFIPEFQNLAKELGIVIPVSFFEQSGQARYNSIAIVDADGTLLGVYRKSHIPDGPGYQEKFYFRPGDTGFRTWPTRFGRIGVGICWDQWFPETARAMMLQGAEILFYPTAIGSEPHDPNLNTKDRWQRAMVGHAVSNVVPIVAANRVGLENGQRYYGHSFIADFSGEKVAELNSEEEGIVMAEFDLQAIALHRAAWGFFRDRRTDLYDVLLTSDGKTTPPIIK